MAALPTLIAQIKDAVGAVGKDERNAQQGFNFRGIDAVVNALAPHLIAHEVCIVPNVRTYEYGTVEVGKARTPMGHAQVTVEFTMYGPDGDTITGATPGEAMDSGDKATAKAMSVAYRTFLLQAFSLPTTEMDPDAVVYQRTDPAVLNAAVQRVRQAWSAHGAEVDDALIAADYNTRYGTDIRQAGVDELNAYATALGAPPPPTTQEMLQRATATPETASQTVKDPS